MSETRESIGYLLTFSSMDELMNVRNETSQDDLLITGIRNYDPSTSTIIQMSFTKWFFYWSRGSRHIFSVKTGPFWL